MEKKFFHPIVKRRQVGGRQYRIRLDENFISEKDGWEISEYRNWSNGDWISIKVFDVRPEGSRRSRIYQIGYNRAFNRMSRNSCWQKLLDLEPDVSDWIQNEVRKYCQIDMEILNGEQTKA